MVASWCLGPSLGKSSIFTRRCFLRRIASPLFVHLVDSGIMKVWLAFSRYCRGSTEKCPLLLAPNCLGDFSYVSPTAGGQVSYTSNKHVKVRKTRWWGIFQRLSDTRIIKISEKKRDHGYEASKIEKRSKNKMKQSVVTPDRKRIIYGVTRDLGSTFR